MSQREPASAQVHQYEQSPVAASSQEWGSGAASDRGRPGDWCSSIAVVRTGPVQQQTVADGCEQDGDRFILLDPGLDTSAAIGALRSLLADQRPGAPPDIERGE